MQRKLTRALCLLMLVLLVVPVATSLAQDSSTQPLIGSWDACPEPTKLSGTVSLGAVFALSGAASVYGKSQQQAVDLAVEEINSSGYLGKNATLEVKYEDSASKGEQAITAMTKLVQEDKVPAVLGPTLSAEAVAADPVAMDGKTVVLGVSNTATGLTTKLGDYYFRDSLPESAVIPGTIAQATKLLSLTKVGVLYGNDDDFTKSGYDVFKQALQDNNIEITGEQTFSKGTKDFNAQLTSLIDGSPDALVVSALAAEAVPIIQQARALGFDGPIIGGNGFNSPAVLQQSGADAEGLIVGGAWNLGNPNPSKSSVAFADAYQKKYNAAPDQFSAQAYTGAWLLATAIRCGDAADSETIRTQLAQIKDFESPLGTFAFDDVRDPVHEPIAQIVKDGKFTPLTLVAGGAEMTPEATEAAG
jgi:branched-chain amino acid transport system substrate-binding protein